MRILLVVNPYATNYDTQQRRVVEKALGSDHDLEVRETARPGHGLPITQGAVADGFDTVVAWGGDGMVNEAAAGLAGTEVALGILPGGSTNVCARTLGIPLDIMAAAGNLLRWLDEGRTRRIGLGSAGGRTFTFVCGLGFDAAVVREVESRSALKRTIGPSVYLLGAVATFRNFDRRQPQFRLRFDDGTTSPPLFQAFVCNSSPYTYLGNMPMVIIPEAGYDRPLEILGLTRLPWVGTIRLGLSAFWHQRYLRESPYTFRATVEHVVVEKIVPFDVHQDAEYRGKRDSLEISWMPECLSVYCGQGSAGVVTALGG